MALGVCVNPLIHQFRNGPPSLANRTLQCLAACNGLLMIIVSTVAGRPGPLSNLNQPLVNILERVRRPSCAELSEMGIILFVSYFANPTRRTFPDANP